MCFTLNYFGSDTMRQKKLKNRASETMHKKCMYCLLKNSCSICKDYKELKDNGFTATADLICFMEILNKEATYGLKNFKDDTKDFKTWALKMHLHSYAKTFGLLWKLYKNNDENRLSINLRKYVHVYTCHILERHGLLSGIEVMTGIDLTTQYNDFIFDLAIEEVSKHEKNF